MLAETTRHPGLTTSVAGALKFSQYGSFKRRKALAKYDHLEPDAEHDVEYTDWDSVSDFAESFSRQVEAALSAV